MSKFHCTYLVFQITARIRKIDINGSKITHEIGIEIFYFRKLYIETVIMEIGPINSLNGDNTSITQEI